MKVDLKRFCEDYDVAVVVVSRDRADVLAKKTDTFMEGYHLFYSGEGYEDHQYHCVERHEVPRGLQGLSLVRNYVLDTLPHRIVIFVDDDISMIYWVAGAKAVRLDREGVKLAFINMVVHALDQNSLAFGMSNIDIRKASPLIPFDLRKVVGAVIGVVGREIRFDERNILKTDYDFFLMAMVKNRIVHIDRRYFFIADVDGLPGGNMSFRSQERRQREIDNLIRWWGEDVIVPGMAKTVEKLTVRVP